jgi:diguanylate cyclase (GGDEF)-like protein
MADLEPRVLIVDDEKRDIKLVEEALSPIRVRILTLAEPREVLRKVESESPDVVILDALLPGMSGFDLCKEIKTSPDSKNTAVLILTGVYLRDHYRREAIHQFKADGFLIKPFRVRELQRTFLKILARKLRMSPRKVQEELVADQDILLPSELDEKSGWLGRIFGKLRSAPEPSVKPGFLRAATTPERAPAESEKPVGATEPVVEPTEEELAPEPVMKESEREAGTVESEPSEAEAATAETEAAEREVDQEPGQERVREEREESEEPEKDAEAEEKSPEEPGKDAEPEARPERQPEESEEPRELEKDTEAEEDKKADAQEPSEPAETSEPDEEKVEDTAPDEAVEDEEPAPVPPQPEEGSEPDEIPKAEQDEPVKEEPLETVEQGEEAAAEETDEEVQGHLSSVWDDLPAGEPEEAPSEEDSEATTAEAREDSESAEPARAEPQTVEKAGPAEAEPEAVIEAETVTQEPVEAEPVVSEPEPESLSEKESAPETVPTLEGEAVPEAEAPTEPEPEPEPELTEERHERPGAPSKPVDLDSAKALFEAIEVEDFNAEDEAEKLANADPSATMPAIDPVIIQKIKKAKAVATPKAAPSEEIAEESAEEIQATDKAPATEPTTESVSEEPKAEPPEALPVEEVGVIGATTKVTASAVTAQPELVAEVSREDSDTGRAKEPVPEPTGEAEPHAPEPAPGPVAEPEYEPATKPMVKPAPEPAVETEEEPTLEVPEELAIYRERDFLRELKRELSKCRRVERPLTLILVRITDLGQIVEIFGKTYRPKVLMHVAEQVLSALRDVDSVGLLESREFLALTAFASDRYGGERIIARLRKALRNHPFDVGLGIAGFVPKLFFGMASFPKDANTVDELLEQAEKEITEDKPSR